MSAENYFCQGTNKKRQLKTNYFRDPNEKIKPNDKILSHLLLAFEAPSMMSPDIYAMAIINTLFGGGGSFSAGLSNCFFYRF